MAHKLDHHDPAVALRRRMKAVNGVCGYCKGGVETKSPVSAFNVVVYGFGKPKHI